MYLPFDPEVPLLSNYPTKIVPYMWKVSNKMVYSLQDLTVRAVWKQHA